MDISTVNGVPAHPLLIHIPVMGIPLCALLVLLCVARRQWRPSLTIPLGLATIVTMIGTLIAAGSGERLQAMLPPGDRRSSLLQKHTELGDQTKVIVLIFGFVTLAYLALGWYRDRAERNGGTPAIGGIASGLMALGIFALVLGGISTVWDVRTGHAGAKSAWSDVAAQPTAPNTGESGSAAPSHTSASIATDGQ